MACLIAGAGMTAVFSSSQLSSRYSLSSQFSGFSGTCTSVPVVSKGHGIRAAGTQASQLSPLLLVTN